MEILQKNRVDDNKKDRHLILQPRNKSGCPHVINYVLQEIEVSWNPFLRRFGIRFLSGFGILHFKQNIKLINKFE